MREWRYSLVDGIPFELPVASHHSPALMAVVQHRRRPGGQACCPGSELHPLRLPGGRGVLMITVIDYTSTNIGKYIEFSIAIGVTHGLRPAPAVAAACFSRGTTRWASTCTTCPSAPRSLSRVAKASGVCPSTRPTSTFASTLRRCRASTILTVSWLCASLSASPAGPVCPLRMGSANFCQFRGHAVQIVDLLPRAYRPYASFAKAAAQLLSATAPGPPPSKTSTSAPSLS